MKNRNELFAAMIAVAVACFGNSASAQTSIEENDIVRSALDEMFEDLDKSRVPTGYLLDYAVGTLGLRRHGADRQQLCGPGTACGHIAECQVGIGDSKRIGGDSCGGD